MLSLGMDIGTSTVNTRIKEEIYHGKDFSP